MKKIILFTLCLLLTVFAITVVFMVLQYKYEKIELAQAKFEIKISMGDGNFSPTGISEKNIKKVDILNTSDNAKGIRVFLDDNGRTMLEEITGSNIGNIVGLFLDGVPISLPRVNEAIETGQLIITDNNFSDTDLLNLKARLLGYYYKNSDEYKNFNLNSGIQEIQKQNNAVDNNIEVRASHLLICFEGALRCEGLLTKDDAYRKIKEIQKIATPDNFIDLAKKYSMEPGADKSGGDLGWFGRGVMVEPFEVAVFNQNVMSISPIIETEFGYHLIFKQEERMK